MSAPPEGEPDPRALLRSREYVRLLLLSGIIGAPVSAVSYGFLKLVADLHAFFESIPTDLGLDPVPDWWPFPPVELPGVALAALATLTFGVVLGPEAPLIAIGSGLGVRALVFLGLDSLTGFGTFSLTVPGLPSFDYLTVAIFACALLFGAVAPFLGHGIRQLALAVRPRGERHMLLAMPALGLAIAALALGFAEITGKDVSMVLFSGQDQLGTLLTQGASWSVGVLVAVAVCKAVAYGLSLSSFRGGPVFPSTFVGAAAGVAASHLPGLPMIRRWP